MIQWVTDLEAAIVAGKAQSKRVFLLGGKTNCAATQLMKSKCESLSSITWLIEKYFIPFWSEKTPTAGGASYEFYAKGLGTYNLPLFVVFDPNDSGNFLGRMNGLQTPEAITEWLKMFSEEAAPLTSTASRQSIIPYILADSQWWCGLNITNTGEKPATVTIEYFNDKGSLVHPEGENVESLVLEPRCSTRFMINVPVGWARMTAPDNVYALEFMGDKKSSFMGAVFPQ